MRVAVVGAGVAGLAAAWTLAKSGCQVTLYEREEHVGGHAWTVDAEEKLPVDVGFMVFNRVSHAVLPWQLAISHGGNRALNGVVRVTSMAQKTRQRLLVAQLGLVTYSDMMGPSVATCASFRAKTALSCMRFAFLRALECATSATAQFEWPIVLTVNLCRCLVSI